MINSTIQIIKPLITNLYQYTVYLHWFSEQLQKFSNQNVHISQKVILELQAQLFQERISIIYNAKNIHEKLEICPQAESYIRQKQLIPVIQSDIKNKIYEELSLLPQDFIIEKDFTIFHKEFIRLYRLYIEQEFPFKSQEKYTPQYIKFIYAVECYIRWFYESELQQFRQPKFLEDMNEENIEILQQKIPFILLRSRM